MFLKRMLVGSVRLVGNVRRVVLSERRLVGLQPSHLLVDTIPYSINTLIDRQFKVDHININLNHVWKITSHNLKMLYGNAQYVTFTF